MSDRPDAWAARRRAWRIERLAPSLERLPERRERFATLGDLPVEGLYGPWDLERGADDGDAAGPRRPDRGRPPRRPAARRRRPLRRRRPVRDVGLPGRAAVHPRHPPDGLPLAAVDDAHVRRASARPRTRTPASGSCSTPARRASRSPTTCRPCTATTPTTPRPRASSGPAASRVSSLADMELLLDGPAARPRQHLDDDQRAGGADLGDVHRGGREGRACRGPRSRARPRTTSSRSTSPRRSSCTRPSRRCGSWSTRSSSARRELPRWNTVSISGYHIREAGSTAVQELAFTIADGMAYVEAASPAACGSTTSRPGSRSSSTATRDFFEEIAKFRASRRIWWKLMSERYRAENERSTWMRFHTQTAGRVADARSSRSTT